MVRLLLTTAFVILLGSLVIAAAAQPEALDYQSSYVHGTIDVVISTRNGFVLATDSRGTQLTGEHSDNLQKLFPVGSHAACVIAGIVGAEFGGDGFDLRDAIGSHITRLARLAEQDNSISSAPAIIESFQHGLDGVAGLLAPSTPASPLLVGAVSAVSITPDGHADWVTLYIPVEAHIVIDRPESTYFTPGKQIYLFHRLLSGLRFDIDVLGVPRIAEEMLRGSKPSQSNELTKTTVMRRYYRRKASGRLDDYTLNEALELARTLVRATERYADPSDGVGGPIDTLILTKDDIRRPDQKRNVAPLPAPWQRQLVMMGFANGTQPLDGLSCVRCIFENMTLRYAGTGEVQLPGAQFIGTCALQIVPGARTRNPQMTQHLIDVLRGKCSIVE